MALGTQIETKLIFFCCCCRRRRCYKRCDRSLIAQRSGLHSAGFIRPKSSGAEPTPGPSILRSRRIAPPSSPSPPPPPPATAATAATATAATAAAAATATAATTPPPFKTGATQQPGRKQREFGFFGRSLVAVRVSGVGSVDQRVHRGQRHVGGVHVGGGGGGGGAARMEDGAHHSSASLSGLPPLLPVIIDGMTE